jgi:hypothetical protein
MTLTHKNFIIINLIVRDRDAEKTLSGRWNPNFEVIYEEQVMAHIKNHTNHYFET